MNSVDGLGHRMGPLVLESRDRSTGVLTGPNLTLGLFWGKLGFEAELERLG